MFDGPSEMSLCTPPPALAGRRKSSKMNLNNQPANATQAKLLALAKEDEEDTIVKHPKKPTLQRAETAPASSEPLSSIPTWENLPPPPPTPVYNNVNDEDLPSPFLRKTENKITNNNHNPRQGLLAQAAAQRSTKGTLQKRPSMVSLSKQNSTKPVLGR